jgi:Domain of Unknown Function (DUF1080)
MKVLSLLYSLALASSFSAAAETINFDSFPAGSPPPGWQVGQTGKGNPEWKVQADASAPSAPNVLRQSGSGDYPWCVKTGSSLTDGTVEVKFKPVSGRGAQAGGVMFRFKGESAYYVARANANENNVNLYWFDEKGRHEAKFFNTPVSLNQWHTLRAEFKGKRIVVALDGKTVIDVEDDHITGAGAVGLWTRHDSNTMFDDFTFSGN